MTADIPDSSRTIFLVDDEAATIELYSRGLQQAGFTTNAAPDAEKATAALSLASADLIIVDLMLPRRSGFELLSMLRAEGPHKETPILALSNSYLPEMTQRGLRAGGNKALPRSELTSSGLILVSQELLGIAQPGSAAAEPGAETLAEQLRKDLLEEGCAEIATIRQHCLQFGQSTDSQDKQALLAGIYQSIRFLSTRAGLTGFGKIAQLTGAIEAMLFDQISRSNGALSASLIQTLVQAVNCLGVLFTNRSTESFDATCNARVLLVDDDEVCNMANEVALKRAHYEAINVTNGTAALDVLNDEEFDLILLDINMPGMTGLQLCEKLRRMPHHANTPVIFVTLNGEFETRAKSLVSGGNDLISKPISPLELIVKATVFLSTNPNPRGTRITSSTAEKNKGTPAASKANTAHSPKGEHTKGGHAHAAINVKENVKEKLKYLQEALAEETNRRKSVEQQAAENAKRRKELEAAIDENQRSQQWFRELLEQSQKEEGEQGKSGGQMNLTGRRRALLECRDFVADKLFKLKKALAEETERFEAMEAQVAENAKRRTDLEAALGEIQAVQAAFQGELDAADNPEQLLQLQSSLTEKEQNRLKIQAELEEAQRELQELRGAHAVKDSDLAAKEAKLQELQAARTEAEQQVEKLKEALEAEKKRRETIKQRAAEHAQCRDEVEAALAQNQLVERLLQREREASESATRRGELEAELAENKQAQTQLRNDLANAQKQLQVLREANTGDKEAKLQARAEELETARAEV
ncbi:MAG TPA: response regulator, partial [Candidatus Dormibacteraeota bacterium]|nr:response regulator [Candidatus Dormibacteraeota bacterium]